MPDKNEDYYSPHDETRNDGPSSWSIIVIILIIGIILYYTFMSDVNDRYSVSLPYSAFKEQVRKGNVAEVTIKGNTISGEFKETYKKAQSDSVGTFSYTSFTTINPEYENQTLMSLLEENNVTVFAQKEETSWLVPLFLLFLPLLFIFGYGILFLFRKMQSGMSDGGGAGDGLFGVGKSRAKRYTKTARTAVSFNDVAGMSNAKKDLLEIVEYLRNPHKFSTLGAEIPKGILLMGAPGTGKTLLARATAGEAEVPFFSTSGSEFIEMFVGVGASRVRDMFNNAKKEAPSIIFIDEVDSVGASRGASIDGGANEREQTLNQILSEMDGFAPHESVVVMAATNRPDVLDPALTRPGRFDRQIVLDLPERCVRLEILKIHTRKVPLNDNVDLSMLAGRTVGFSGADLKNLVNEAALLAGRKNKKYVETEDFDEASDKILLGEKREEKIGDEEKRLIAYHEAGHALVAKLLPDTDPLQKVTIVARGRALGVTEQIPEIDRHNLNREYLLSRLAVALAGRASEKLVFNDLTNGAAEDLKQSTRLARKMICQWGMSDLMGPPTYNQGEDQAFLGHELAQPRDFSEYTARLIDKEVQRMLVTMESRATQLLEKNRNKLDKLASALLEHETLQKYEVDQILEL